MTDHAVLIPTSEGPVGGVVSEPGGTARVALVILAGYGRPARSGVNAFWTRTARALAGRGVVVLRLDYSREGETLPIGEGGSGQAWKVDLDLRLLTQAVRWFDARTAGLPLLLAGVCSGGRLAIELAGREPPRVAATFLVVPYLRALAPPGAEGVDRAPELAPVDPLLVARMGAALARGPGWILTGERDEADVAGLRRLVGPSPHPLELEVLPAVALHLLDRPHLQESVSARLLARIPELPARLGSANLPEFP